jgi:hypothetical protein
MSSDVAMISASVCRAKRAVDDIFLPAFSVPAIRRAVLEGGK